VFESVDKIWEVIIAVTLAVAGGLARVLNLKDKVRLKLSFILSELFISGFAGLMVLLLARSFGLADDWLGLICGMSGWVGPKILDLVSRKAGQAVGLDLSTIQPEPKEEPKTKSKGKSNA